MGNLIRLIFCRYFSGILGWVSCFSFYLISFSVELKSMITTKRKPEFEGAVVKTSVEDKRLDFDVWASQVKQQMLAALARRGMR
jgi:hypothetical protein